MSIDRLAPKLAAACAMTLAIAAHGNAPAAAPASSPVAYLSPTKENYLHLAAETEAALREHVLGVWFPRCVDSKNGGFLCNFTRDWQPDTSQGKFSVFQGRMTWIAAEVAIRRPDLREQFLPVARHGVQFLSGTMWDKQHGGIFWGLDDSGQLTPQFTDGKHLYGISFCLYGTAGAYQATNDPAALELAQRIFAGSTSMPTTSRTADTSNGSIATVRLYNRRPPRPGPSSCPSRVFPSATNP